MQKYQKIPVRARISMYSVAHKILTNMLVYDVSTYNYAFLMNNSSRLGRK